MVEVRKKEHETSQALIRRFKKQLQKSGVLSLVRSKMHKDKPLSKLKLREGAAARQKTKQHMDYLKKIGRMEPTTTRRRRRR